MGSSGGQTVLYANYTVPSNNVGTAFWQITAITNSGVVTVNNTLDTSCTNQSFLQLRYLVNVTGGSTYLSYGQCYSGTAWTGNYSYYNGTVFNPSLYDEHGTFVARPDAWWPAYGIAVEVDSKEWHTSPEDHAKTLARGRRMARYQIVVLRFTPRQIRSQPAEVRNDIKAALDGAQGRPLLRLKTIPVNNGAAA